MYKCFIFLIFTISYSGATEASKAPNMFSHSAKALLSYQKFRDRTDELVIEIRRKTFGEYSDEVLMLLPLVTGEVEFTISDVKFYHQHKSDKSGLKYVYNF